MKPRVPDTHTVLALLRGINVGGKNRLAMRDLTECVKTLGGLRVETYIQSGNVLFRARNMDLVWFAQALGEELHRAHALDVPVITRTRAELREAIDQLPFAARKADDGKTLHVLFLSRSPTKKEASALDHDRSPPDKIELRGANLYLETPNGLGQTRYSNAYLDKTLNVVSTARNWKTVCTLMERADRHDVMARSEEG